MAATDVDLVRNAFERLPQKGYEALLPLVHPEFEMETPVGQAAEPQLYRGVDGMRRWWESFYEVMDEVRVEPVAYHDAGDGMVVVEVTLSARGQASGLETSQPACLLCTQRDGLLARIEFFGSADEALAAAAER
jgi:ketosteroid isomerase-like protein